MTMDVEDEPQVAEMAEAVNRDQIFDFLTSNESICFKSQQIGEEDLTKQQKTEIALEVYDKSKLNFLLRFGKHLKEAHLEFFEQFTRDDCEDCYEISLVLRDFGEILKTDAQVNVKNRRYEALQKMIREDSAYFSEIEMMKRNPLLYDQLVGQYLTQDEKLERDRIEMGEEATLVKVLMEGIERDDAKIKKQVQETHENETIMDEDEDEDSRLSFEKSQDPQPATFSQWGEFDNEQVVKTIKTSKIKNITAQEQRLLKEEFITSMYQSFLEGRDEDFDYDKIDNNAEFDNLETKDCDEEERYFDSEEPETVEMENVNGQESSEDELDIYMSALNQNPAVKELSKELQKL